MRIDLVRLMMIQGVLLAAEALLVYKFAGQIFVKSFVYGNTVAIVLAALLIFRNKQSLLVTEAQSVLRLVYKTAIERFVWAIFLLGIGFKLLELSPLWLLVGFVAGQAVWLLASIWI
jgi:hypothetical protein